MISEYQLNSTDNGYVQSLAEYPNPTIYIVIHSNPRELDSISIITYNTRNYPLNPSDLVRKIQSNCIGFADIIYEAFSFLADNEVKIISPLMSSCKLMS